MPESVTTPRGNQWRYRYDDVGNVLFEADPRYSATPIERGKPYVTAFTYDPFNRVRNELTPRLSASSDLAARSTERIYTYDVNDNLTQMSLSAVGQTLTYLRSYDANDNLTCTASPAVKHAGSDLLNDTSSSMRELQQFTYDQRDNLRTETSPEGLRDTGSCGSLFPNPPSQHTTTYRYDALDRPVATVQRGDTDSLITATRYDKRSNPIAFADPQGSRAANATDVASALAGVSGDANLRYQWTYNAADERRKQFEDPAGLNLTTEWSYDGRGRVASVVAPNGAVGGADVAAQTDTFVYDGRDDLLKVTEGAPDNGSGRQRRVTEYVRYADGQVKAVLSPRNETGDAGAAEEGQGSDCDAGSGGSSGGSTANQNSAYSTVYTYNEDGRVKPIQLPHSGRRFEEAIRPIRIAYNQVGDPIRVSDAFGCSASADNAFYDTGELQYTVRPWMWTVVLDPSGQRQELQLKDPSQWSQPDDLTKPSSEGQGDFGAVGAMPASRMLPLKGLTSFDYDARMRVTGINEFATNEQTLLGRDSLGRLTRLEQPFDANPIVTGFAYDFNGNRVLVRAPDITGDNMPEVTQTTYDAFDRPTIITEPGAAQGAPGNAGNLPTPARVSTSMSYDPNGTVRDVTDPRGLLTSYGYDRADRRVKVQRPGQNVTRYGYDANGNRTCVQRPKGNVDDGPCVSGPFSSTLEYTEHDQLAAVRESRIFDGNSQVVETRYEYDRDGNQTKVDAPGAQLRSGVPARHVTRMEYDGRGLVWKRTEGHGSSSAHSTIFEHDPNGNLRRVVAPRGITEFGVTAQNDIPQKGAPTGLANRDATVNQYDADNLLTARWLPASDDVPQARQDIARYTSGEILSIESPQNPNGTGRTVKNLYSYYKNGWVKTQREVYSANGTDDPSEDIGKRKSEYEYDLQGHQTKWIRADGSGGGGRTTTRKYWPNGLLARRTADGGPVDQRSYGYGYNKTRSLVEVLDHQIRNGENQPRSTQLVYDELERLKEVDETWQTGKDTRYDYDANSNRTSVMTEIDSGSATKWKTTGFIYDTLDSERRMTVTVDGQTGPARTVSTDVFGSGLPSARSKSNGATESFFYDELGRLSRRTHSESLRNSRVDYDYDPNGNRNAITARTSAGDDRPETFSYNARDQLISWTRRPDAKPINGQNVNSVTYEYTPGGALKKNVENHGGGVTVSTVFDSGVDDQLDKTVTTAAEQTSSGPIETTTTRFYRYDQRGNVVCAGASENTSACTDGKLYTYDAFDRQTSAHNADRTIKRATVYDAFDRRDFTCVNPTGDHLNPSCPTGSKRDLGYYGITDKLSAEITGDNELRTYDRNSSLVALGQDVTPQQSAPATHTYRPYVLDDQGTVTELENGSNGQVKAFYEYDPYGETTFGDKGDDQGDTPTTQIAQDNPIRFQGFVFDSTTRQYDMQARQYQPEIARFLTIDQFELGAGDQALQADPLTQHRYAFLAGNPTSRIEYDGHMIPLGSSGGGASRPGSSSPLPENPPPENPYFVPTQVDSANTVTRSVQSAAAIAKPIAAALTTPMLGSITSAVLDAGEDLAGAAGEQASGVISGGIDRLDRFASCVGNSGLGPFAATGCVGAVGAEDFTRSVTDPLGECDAATGRGRAHCALTVAAVALGGFGAARAGLPAAAKTGGRVADDAIAGARYPLSPKIQNDIGKRGWTTEGIDEAVQSGQQVRAINKATGDPATRYIHPSNGQSVVIDDVTGQVIHAGGPGFKYGPQSGDVP